MRGRNVHFFETMWSMILFNVFVHRPELNSTERVCLRKSHALYVHILNKNHELTEKVDYLDRFPLLAEHKLRFKLTMTGIQVR